MSETPRFGFDPEVALIAYRRAVAKALAERERRSEPVSPFDPWLPKSVRAAEEVVAERRPLAARSPDEYLAEERAAFEKHELINGRVYRMAPATKDHLILVANLYLELRDRLRPRGYRLYPTDQLLRVSATDFFTYPDLSIAEGAGRTCGEQVLLDPVAIVEVLSKSTEAYDRGEKFAQYRRINELRTYVLVSSLAPRVEVFERQDDGGWLMRDFSGLDATVTLPALGIKVPMGDVYREVVPASGATPDLDR